MKARTHSRISEAFTKGPFHLAFYWTKSDLRVRCLTKPGENLCPDGKKIKRDKMGNTKKDSWLKRKGNWKYRGRNGQKEREKKVQQAECQVDVFQHRVRKETHLFNTPSGGFYSNVTTYWTASGETCRKSEVNAHMHFLSLFSLSKIHS